MVGLWHDEALLWVDLAGNLLPALPTAQPVGLDFGFAMADFTGDTHPDLATVELNRFDSANAKYVIEIRLSEGGHQFLTTDSSFRWPSHNAEGCDRRWESGLGNPVRAVSRPRGCFLNDGQRSFFRG